MEIFLEVLTYFQTSRSLQIQYTENVNALSQPLLKSVLQNTNHTYINIETNLDYQNAETKQS